MKKLPNNITVYNSTPHNITFWKEGWEDVVIVEPDNVINAVPTEKVVRVENDVEFVTTEFQPTKEGKLQVLVAGEAGADVIVGSIIAAQAYPEQVVAMTPCKGYERVAPAEKRMNPDKFTVFTL